jgi:hypothetical protein
MTAVLQNVSMNVGDTPTIIIGPILEQSTGAYSNLAGATAIWALGKGYGSLPSDVLLTKTTAGLSGSFTNLSSSNLFFTSQVINSNIAYYLNIPFIKSDTVNLPPSPMYSPWYHEAEVTDASGNISTVTTGNFALLWSIINQ